jgi:hypothetical protein
VPKLRGKLGRETIPTKWIETRAVAISYYGRWEKEKSKRRKPLKNVDER